MWVAFYMLDIYIIWEATFKNIFSYIPISNILLILNNIIILNNIPISNNIPIFNIILIFMDNALDLYFIISYDALLGHKCLS